MQKKLLIVDDEPELRNMLKEYFMLKGYLVYTAKGGQEAMACLSVQPDLILLDINMPEINGIEVCRQIRDRISCPILFLTARIEEQDRINGLLSGGDDYILKPFSLRELEARVISHIRREERQIQNARLVYQKNLWIDYIGKSVQYNGEQIDLTRMEYDIVEFLSMHPGQVFDRERIYEKVCGYDADGDSRVMTELIRRIRKKIAVYTEDEFIETVWGSGYKWKK